MNKFFIISFFFCLLFTGNVCAISHVSCKLLLYITPNALVLCVDDNPLQVKLYKKDQNKYHITPMKHTLLNDIVGIYDTMGNLYLNKNMFFFDINYQLNTDDTIYPLSNLIKNTHEISFYNPDLFSIKSILVEDYISVMVSKIKGRYDTCSNVNDITLIIRPDFKDNALLIKVGKTLEELKMTVHKTQSDYQKGNNEVSKELSRQSCYHIPDSTELISIQNVKVESAYYFNDATDYGDSIIHKSEVYLLDPDKLSEKLSNPDTLIFKDSCDIGFLFGHGCLGLGGQLIINDSIQLYSPCGKCACGGNEFIIVIGSFELLLPISLFPDKPVFITKTDFSNMVKISTEFNNFKNSYLTK